MSACAVIGLAHAMCGGRASRSGGRRAEGEKAAGRGVGWARSHLLPRLHLFPQLKQLLRTRDAHTTKTPISDTLERDQGTD